MNRKLLASAFLISLFLIGTTRLLAYDAEPSSFRYKATIDGQINRNAVYRVILGNGVLDKCENMCHDLRVYDKEKKEIPYVILENMVPAKQSGSYVLDIQSYDEGANADAITLKRTNPPGPGTRIYIETQDRDFHKTVSISGSNDLKTWEPLGEDRIYDFSSQVDLRKTFATMKRNSYRYLRFTMKNYKKSGESQQLKLTYDGLDLSVKMPVDKKLRIGRFLVQDYEENRGSVTFDESLIRPQIVNDNKRKVTEMVIEAPFPVASVELALDNPYYLRTVKLFGATKKEGEEFVFIQQTSVYNLSIAGQKEIKNRIEIPISARYRFYKIVIENQSNPPLQCEKVTLRWIQKQLFFIGLDDNQQYSIYWGNPSTGAVTYDLSALIKPDDWFNRQTESLNTSLPMQNTDYIPGKNKETLARIEKYILTGVIILLVLVAGFFLFQLWKKASDKT
jgi:hypothetical protein